MKAWLPWVILSVFVFIWGTPQFKAFLDGIWIAKLPVAGLHNLVMKVPPVVAEAHAEAAVYNLNLLSATGTGILIAAIISGLILGYGPAALVRMYGRTIYLIRYSLLTIACMLALGYVTRYSGTDATMGLAFAQAGWLYPLFGTLLGWLGVAVTGSDTASNVLFGGLQKITAQQLGLNPVLMAAANSSGGVMGKMIDAQSIVVASTATKWYGHEGSILRYVFFHSIALAVLVGLLVMAQAYVPPFTGMVPDMPPAAAPAPGERSRGRAGTIPRGPFFHAQGRPDRWLMLLPKGRRRASGCSSPASSMRCGPALASRPSSSSRRPAARSRCRRRRPAAASPPSTAATRCTPPTSPGRSSRPLSLRPCRGAVGLLRRDDPPALP